jgi:hypothetical protein
MERSLTDEHGRACMVDRASRDRAPTIASGRIRMQAERCGALSGDAEEMCGHRRDRGRHGRKRTRFDTLCHPLATAACCRGCAR